MSDIPDLSGIFGQVLKNPELLGSLMQMAGTLSKGLGLFSPSSADEDEEKSETVKTKETDSIEDVPLLLTEKERGRGKMMQKHKKLIEALMLYVDDDKKSRFELVLKILDVVSVAEELRGS